MKISDAITKLKTINWKEQVKTISKEKAIVAACVVAGVLLTLWIAASSKPQNDNRDGEFGLLIPKGYLVVPLEIANAQSLNGLVSRTAVVDVFKPGETQALVENLKIIKLDAGEGPLFGALVPEKMAGMLQQAFSRPNLKAALRTLKPGDTVFHLHTSTKPLLIEVPTGD